MKLTMFAGLFVKIRGSDRIVHFGAINPNNLKVVTDLYEVVLFRKLRRALASGLISQVESTGESFGLVLASAVTRILGALPPGAVTISHLNETCGSLLEALRLLRVGGGRARPLHYRAFIPSLEHVRYFRAFNEVVKEEDPDITTEWVSSEGRLGRLPVDADTSALVVVDLLKQDPSRLFWALDRQFDASTARAPMLAVARVALESETRVTDVMGLSYDLPTIAGIADWCERHPVVASYLMLEHFDRDFLLPFDGRYGVCLLYVACEGCPEFLEFGFRDIHDGRRGGTQLPAVVETVSRQRNYDQTFNAKLPYFETAAEPDWTLWAKERAWEPEACDWSAGPCPGDPFVFAVRSEKTADVMACFEQLAEADLQSQQIGPFGVLQMAVCATTLAVVDKVSLILRAVDRADRDPVIVEFLVRNLYDATRKRRPAGTPGTLSDLVEVFPAIGWTTRENTAEVVRRAAELVGATSRFRIELEAALAKFGG